MVGSIVDAPSRRSLSICVAPPALWRTMTGTAHSAPVVVAVEEKAMLAQHDVAAVVGQRRRDHG